MFVSVFINAYMPSYQHVKVFPEVLCHESEESQEGPAEAVKAGVAVVWIPPSFHTCVALRAAAEGWRKSERKKEREGGGAPGPKHDSALFTYNAI